MNLLIPYVQLVGHNDPCFQEYTYGDVGSRATKLKKLEKGDYIFFHTGYNGRKYIRACYVVERVLDVAEAVRDRNIIAKYKNPHISEYFKDKRSIENVIVFGDPITSRILERPLVFDRALAERLSLRIRFPRHRSEAQSIGSSTRSWRELSNKDVEILLEAIKSAEVIPIAGGRVLSTDEVTEVLEKDIENFIQQNPKLIGKSVKLVGRQVTTPVGNIDLLFRDKQNKFIVVELKLGKIGHKAVGQIQRYINLLKKQKNTKNVFGIIVCQGVMSAFQEDLRRLKNIKIFCYGWELKVHPWNRGN